MEFHMRISKSKLVAITNKKNISIAALDKQCNELKQFNIKISK